MTAEELDDFIREAKSLTRSRNAEAQENFGIGRHARYDLDLASCRLSFSDADGTQVATSRIVAVGSWSRASGSWLWSWENESIPKAASDLATPIREFGEMHDVPAMQASFSPCSEELAWALAAVSLKILDGASVYRVEQPKNSLFVLLFDLTVPAASRQE